MKFLSPDSLPHNTTICEPSKLTQEQIIKLWSHWRQRQSGGEHGVEFISARLQDQRQGPDPKGKKKQINFVDPDGTPPPSTSHMDGNVSRQSTVPPPQIEIAGPSNRGQNIVMEDAAQSATKNSPAAHRATKKDRILYLKSLSQQKQYCDMLKGMAKMTV